MGMSRIYQPPQASVPGRLRLGEVDVLLLRVEVDRMHAHLAADAAALEPAEGRLREYAAGRVDADHAGPDALRDPDRPPEVACPDRAGQAVRRRVGQADRL